MENHIQLSLNDIVQGFFPDVDLKAKNKNELPMSVNEMELLAYLRIANSCRSRFCALVGVVRLTENVFEGAENRVNGI